MKKHLLFIVNPKSGKVKIKDSLLEVCQIFCQADYILTLNVTQYINEAIDEALSGDIRYDLIICCGGDGTFNSMVSARFPGKIIRPSAIFHPEAPTTLPAVSV